MENTEETTVLRDHHEYVMLRGHLRDFAQALLDFTTPAITLCHESV
jgi:hypothetical protein